MAMRIPKGFVYGQAVSASHRRTMRRRARPVCVPWGPRRPSGSHTRRFHGLASPARCAAQSCGEEGHRGNFGPTETRETPRNFVVPNSRPWGLALGGTIHTLFSTG